MFVSKIKTKYITPHKSRFCQGDILKDVYISIGIDDGDTTKTTVNRFYLPYCVVMSQDCDLNSDERGRKEGGDQDKYLQSILLCPAYQADNFFQGDHIEGWKMQQHSEKGKKKVQANDCLDRYHYLEGNIDKKIPELVLDFKHFFTAPRDFLYKKRKAIYIATLNELFRERLSQRFANYLSRFGLPDNIKK